MELTVNVINELDVAIVADTILIGNDIFPITSTAVATLIDNGSVDVCVKLSGYAQYDMTIDNVYNEDKVITILITPLIVDTVDPNYNRPYPYLFSFQDPCSFKVDFYNASNSPGETSWYVNNTEILTGSKGSTVFCAPGLYQIKVRGTRSETIIYGLDGYCPTTILLWDRQWATAHTGNTVSGTLDDLAVYLGLDTITNTTVTEHRPSLSLTQSSSVEQEGCYTKGEEVTVTAGYAITQGLSSDYSFAWTVVDPEGSTMIDTTSTIIDNTLSFNLDMLGVYTTTVVMTDNVCNTTYTQSIEAETCNFITFDYIDCNTYTMYNRSSSVDFSYVIESLTEEVSSGTLVAQGTSNIVFGTPSLYLVKVTYNRGGEDILETYVLNNYCVIEECLSSYILDILCEDTRTCATCPDSIELNQFLMLYYTYFMELNKEYGLNNFYSGLDDSHLEALNDIDTVMSKIVEFCSRRGCDFVNCSSC